MKRFVKSVAVILTCIPFLGCASNSKQSAKSTRTEEERVVRRQPAASSRMSGSSTAAPAGSMGSEPSSRLSGSSSGNAPTSSLDSAYFKGRMDQCMQMQPTEKMCHDQMVFECQKKNPSADCQSMMTPSGMRTPSM